MDDIEKIKYHLQLLAEALDPQEHPIASLVILNDWSNADLNIAHDIFEKFDVRIENNEPLNWAEFETAFADLLGVGYQGLKAVILSFFRNDQWVAVCREYANAYPSIEFSEIVGFDRARHGRALEDRVAATLTKANVPYARDVKFDGSTTMIFDFLVHLPELKVAVEVKRELTDEFLPRLTAAVKQISSSHVADEIWVIVENPSSKRRLDLSNDYRVKLFAIDELEQALH